MKLLLVNSVCGIRSTGRIVADIAKEYEAKGWEVRIGYGREAYVPEECKKWAVRIGSKIEVCLHACLVRLWGDHGFGRLRSSFATRKFLEWASIWNPDEVWMHNIHGYYINVEMLFKWIRSRPQMKVRWTLHDCWAWTGRCGHFTYAKCYQWKNECVKCPTANLGRNQKLCPSPRGNFNRKRMTFCGLSNLTLCTPSQWMADLTRESYLKEYPVEVHLNKVDTEIFKPTPSDFRKRLGIGGRKMILGVASSWGERKGLYDFHRLASLLPSDCVIVLIGLSKRQIKELPSGIIGIERTNSMRELAEAYTAADVFFNPSQEETFALVNAEACLCGTKVVIYNTSAMPESVNGFANAIILKENTVEEFIRVLKTL